MMTTERAKLINALSDDEVLAVADALDLTDATCAECGYKAIGCTSEELILDLGTHVIAEHEESLRDSGLNLDWDAAKDRIAS